VYKTLSLSAQEISQFYLDSLADREWLSQPIESSTNSTSKTKSMVRRRNIPLIQNLLISVQSTSKSFNEPGASVIIMTDNFDEVPCQ
jgi:hypothetical protein